MDLSGLESDTYGAGGFKNMWLVGDDILILHSGVAIIAVVI